MTSDVVRNPLLMIAALLIAGAHFLFIYVFAAIACAKGFAVREIAGFGIVPFVNGLATVIALIAVLLILVDALRRMGWRAPKSSDAAAAPIFLAWMTAGFAGLCLVAIVWYSLPNFMVPVC